MGTIRIGSILLFFSLLFSSCFLMDKGYRNSNGQYVPKRPHFKLKDKIGHTFPTNLDTLHIFRHYRSYYQGQKYRPPNDRYSMLNEITDYIKFYPKGRCLEIVIKTKDVFGKVNQLKEDDINPNNAYCGKAYYYSKGGNIVTIESFAYGQGYGTYLTKNFMLNSQGDTLIFDNQKGSKSIYIKEKLPKNWKKYKVDW